MLSHLASQRRYSRFIAGLLLVALLVPYFGLIAAARPARAENGGGPADDDPFAQLQVRMRAWSGRDKAPPRIRTPIQQIEIEPPFGSIHLADKSEFHGAYLFTLEVPGPGTEVSVEWVAPYDPGNAPGSFRECRLYGAVDPVSFPKSAHQEPGYPDNQYRHKVVVPVRAPGLLALECGYGQAGSGPTYRAAVNIKFPATEVCANNQTESQEYAPEPPVAPSPANPLEASLRDTTAPCSIKEAQDTFFPLTYTIPPPPPDNQVGWPKNSVQTNKRLTRVRYKDASTSTICNKLDVTHDEYRVGLDVNYAIDPEAGATGPTSRALRIDSSKVSSAGSDEQCIDRPLNDEIVTTSVPQCDTKKEKGFFKTKVTTKCTTYALSADGKAGTCEFKKSESSFGGFFLPILSAALGGILGGVFGPLFGIIGIAPGIIGAIVGAFLSGMTSLATGAIMGNVSAPHGDLGACSWSGGFITPAATEPPVCTNCGFDPKTITQGQTASYRWQFSPSVVRYEFDCTGSIGNGWKGNVFAENRQGILGPGAVTDSQSCTLKVFNAAGQSNAYTDTLTVQTAGGGGGVPACLAFAFQPQQISWGQSTNVSWSFNPNVVKADFVCDGDLREVRNVAVPQSAPRSHSVSVTPGQSQRCVATVYNSQNQSATCAARVDLVSATACVAPSGLVPSGTLTLQPQRVLPGGIAEITLSWGAVPGAARYDVRLDDGTPERHDDPRFATCSPSPHYYCENGITGTSIANVPVKTGRAYQFWVDPIFEPQRGYCNGRTSFSVAAPPPTPAPAPAPAPTPTPPPAGTPPSVAPRGTGEAAPAGVPTSVAFDSSTRVLRWGAPAGGADSYFVYRRVGAGTAELVALLPAATASFSPCSHDPTTCALAASQEVCFEVSASRGGREGPRAPADRCLSLAGGAAAPVLSGITADPPLLTPGQATTLTLIGANFGSTTGAVEFLNADGSVAESFSGPNAGMWNLEWADSQVKLTLLGGYTRRYRAGIATLLVRLVAGGLPTAASSVSLPVLSP